MKLHKLSCKIHWGQVEGASCRKCDSGITQRDIASQRDRALVAAIQPVEQSLQERAIESAHRYRTGLFN